MELFEKIVKPSPPPNNLFSVEPIKTFWQFKVVYCGILMESEDYIIAEEITVEDGNVLFRIDNKIVGVVPRRNIYKVIQGEKHQAIELRDKSQKELEIELKKTRDHLGEVMHEIQQRCHGR